MVWNRQHVEALSPRDTPWVSVEQPALPAGLTARLLSVDPGDGALTAEINIPAGWTLPSPWSLGTSLDGFIVSGRIKVGDVELSRWDYTFRPAGFISGAVTALEDTRVYVFVQAEPTVSLREGEEPSSATGAMAEAIIALAAMSVPPRKPLTGRVAKFTSRTLRMDAVTGERIFITGAQACNSAAEDDALAADIAGRIEWHECVEEIFQIGSWVSMDDPADELVLEVGSYCFRPPGIPHGPFRTGPDAEMQSLFRVSSELTNNYVSANSARRLWTDYPAENLDATVRKRITSDQVFSTISD
jgi:hypothetical protein